MNNIKEVDIAKGILILFVVIGHAELENTRFIYWFHMPMFFMISGFLINSGKIGGKDASGYIFKKITRLIIPYVSFLLAILIITLGLSLGGEEILSWQFVFKMFVGGKLLIGQFGVFWFITCLVATILIYGLIEKFCKSLLIKLSILVICFLIGHLESYMIGRGYNIYFPGNIDSALVTLSYFYIGVLVKYILRKKRIVKLTKSRIVFVNLMIIGFIGFFSKYFFNHSLDLKYQSYVNPIVTLVAPILFSILILSISFFLAKIKLSKFFITLGSQSLVIMYLHLLFQIIMVKYHIYNPYFFIAVGTVFPLLISFMLKKNRFTNFIFLGNINFTFDDRNIKILKFKKLWKNILFLNLNIKNEK